MTTSILSFKQMIATFKLKTMFALPKEYNSTVANHLWFEGEKSFDNKSIFSPYNKRKSSNCHSMFKDLFYTAVYVDKGIVKLGIFSYLNEDYPSALVYEYDSVKSVLDTSRCFYGKCYTEPTETFLKQANLCKENMSICLSSKAEIKELENLYVTQTV